MRCDYFRLSVRSAWTFVSAPNYPRGERYSGSAASRHHRRRPTLPRRLVADRGPGDQQRRHRLPPPVRGARHLGPESADGESVSSPRRPKSAAPLSLFVNHVVRLWTLSHIHPVFRTAAYDAWAAADSHTDLEASREDRGEVAGLRLWPSGLPLRQRGGVRR